MNKFIGSIIALVLVLGLSGHSLAQQTPGLSANFSPSVAYNWSALQTFGAGAAGTFFNATGANGFEISGISALTKSGHNLFLGLNDGTNAGGINLLSSDGTIRLQATTFSGSDSDLWAEPSGCGSFKVGSIGDGTRVNIAAPHGCVPVVFTGTISGTALTTTGSPALVLGQRITAAGVTAGTLISSGSGNSWTVSISQTVASESMTASAISRANWIVRPGNEGEAFFQSSVSDGSPFEFESELYVRSTSPSGNLWLHSNGAPTVTTDAAHSINIVSGLGTGGAIADSIFSIGTNQTDHWTLTSNSGDPVLSVTGGNPTFLSTGTTKYLFKNGSGVLLELLNGSGNNIRVVPGTQPQITTNSGDLRLTGTSGTVRIDGSITASTLATVGTIAGSICATSGGIILYENGATGCTISLENIKHDIRALNPKTTHHDIMALEPRQFVMNQPENGPVRYGFTAHQVNEVNPLLSTFDGNGDLQAYDPNAILAETVQVVQQQQSEIDAVAAHQDKNAPDPLIPIKVKIDEQQLEIAGMFVWCLFLTAGLAFRYRRN